MARPRSITDAELLAVARAAFLEHGYGVPVSTIARLAGVSSAAVFLRFPTKEALFQRVILGAFEAQVLAVLPEVESEPDPERALTVLARTLLAFFRQHAGLVLLRAAAGSNRMCGLGEGGKGPGPFISGWFERQAAAGRFAPLDPALTARVFCATLGDYAMVEAAGLHPGPQPDPERYIAAVVSMTLRGLLPR